jgi:hypothetical protein
MCVIPGVAVHKEDLDGADWEVLLRVGATAPANQTEDMLLVIAAGVGLTTLRS